MARIRTIKPEFFLNDEIGRLSFAARLFFIGLWTQADREGRLDARLMRLKAVLFPYDDVDVDALLDALVLGGHVIDYEVDGRRYLQIVNFTKHQAPHIKEAQSSIPAPGEHGACISRAAQEGKGKDKTSPSPRGDDAAFDAFWREYPRKVGKKDARKRWQEAVREIEPDLLLTALRRYPFDLRENKRFVPHPATWLNQGRWDDEVPFSDEVRWDA